MQLCAFGARRPLTRLETAVRHTLRSQRLAALFAGGWLMLSFPLLGLWDSDSTVAGIPLFPLALFVIWGGIIATVAWWMETLSAATPPAVDPPAPARD